MIKAGCELTIGDYVLPGMKNSEWKNAERSAEQSDSIEGKGWLCTADMVYKGVFYQREKIDNFEFKLFTCIIKKRFLGKVIVDIFCNLLIHKKKF